MKIKLVIIGLFVISLGAFSQTSKYGTGEDSVQCITNLSLYSNYYKQRNYKDAKKFWVKAWTHCPGEASKNLYIRGISMYKDFIADAKTDEEKFGLLDTLELIYVDRVKYYGSMASQYGRLGVDLMQYAGQDNVEYAKRAHNYLGESVKLTQTKSTPSVLAAFIGAGVKLYSEGELDGDQLFGDYVYVLDIIEEILESDPENDNALKAKELVDQAFLASGAGTCENLENIFPKKLEEDPTNLKLVKNAVTLYKNICPESVSYFNAVEKLYALEKTGKNANLVATLAIKNEEYTKAYNYLVEAVELETDNSKKAIYKASLAELALKKDELQEARKYAREAIELDAGLKAQAYMTIGQIYMNASCGNTDVSKKANYWIAYDYFYKAKTEDETFTEAANKYMSACKARFPSKQEAFFETLEEGQSYTVGCWINETTTVRVND